MIGEYLEDKPDHNGNKLKGEQRLCKILRLMAILE